MQFLSLKIKLVVNNSMWRGLCISYSWDFPMNLMIHVIVSLDSITIVIKKNWTIGDAEFKFRIKIKYVLQEKIEIKKNY